MSDAPGDFTTVSISLRGASKVLHRFRNATKELHDELLEIVTDEVERIADIARDRMEELFKDPGLMQSTVQTNVEDKVTEISGEVFASGLPYLAIHEFGGVIMTPEIFTSASVMHFFAPNYAYFTASRNKAASNEVFTRYTREHPTPIPERSYMRYAMAQRRSEIQRRFAEVGRK